MYKGKMSWVPSDVMSHLYATRDPKMPVADALRDILGLAMIEPAVVAERAVEPYPVLHLKIGEQITFQDAKIDPLAGAVRRQAKGTGASFL